MDETKNEEVLDEEPDEEFEEETSDDEDEDVSEDDSEEEEETSDEEDTKEASSGFDREMHKTKCSDCGNECEVPFKPAEGRPVYCRDCYRKHKPRRF